MGERRHGLVIGVMIAIAAAPLAQAAAGDDIFAKDNIVKIMNRVNGYQLKHPWKKEDRNWIRATYYTGVMAFYRATGDDKLLAQAMQWADKHQWQPGTEHAGSNALTCGQTWLELYAIKKGPKMIEPLLKWIDSGRPNTPTGNKVWYLEGGLRYADSPCVGPQRSPCWQKPRVTGNTLNT